MDTSAVPEGQLSEDELLRAALCAWADQTQELLRWIEGQGDAVSDTRTPKQVMALGFLSTSPMTLYSKYATLICQNLQPILLEWFFSPPKKINDSFASIR